MAMLEYLPMLIPLLFGGVGFLIGRAKGAPLLGSALGLFLGPFGWIAMALIPRKRARYCQLCYGTVGLGTRFARIAINRCPSGSTGVGGLCWR